MQQNRSCVDRLRRRRPLAHRQDVLRSADPPLRPSSGDRTDWGRFDVPGHRTVYGASSQQAAYAESLASLRPALSHDGPRLRDLFDDVAQGDARTLLEAVQQDWAERHHMGPGLLPAGWRTERLIHRLTAPSSGWFVDVEASNTLNVLSTALEPQLAGMRVQHLTVSHLRGDDRRLTTTVTEWLWPQTLDDGSRPHGVTFGSKHGSDWLEFRS